MILTSYKIIKIKLKYQSGNMYKLKTYLQNSIKNISNNVFKYMNNTVLKKSQ